MRVDHDQGDLKTEPKSRFLNHPGSDQLSQEGSQINIIADKTQCPCRPKPIINNKDEISRLDLPVGWL